MVRSVVPAGKGVVPGAVDFHDAGELIGRVLFRPLEHHMFQHMRNTGQTTVFITGPNAVPYLYGQRQAPDDPRAPARAYRCPDDMRGLHRSSPGR